jgi:hypothetical protein
VYACAGPQPTSCLALTADEPMKTRARLGVLPLCCLLRGLLALATAAAEWGSHSCWSGIQTCACDTLTLSCCTTTLWCCCWWRCCCSCSCCIVTV